MALVKKSVCLKGNLLQQSGVLRYKPCPSNEFTNNVKHIAVGSISLLNKGSDTTEVICTVSCNLVKAQNIQNNDKVMSYEQPLQTFITPKKYSVTRFNPVWFTVNSLSEELVITVKDFDNANLKKNYEIQVIMYFS